jgi:hypothetical protein
MIKKCSQFILSGTSRDLPLPQALHQSRHRHRAPQLRSEEGALLRRSRLRTRCMGATGSCRDVWAFGHRSSAHW